MLSTPRALVTFLLLGVPAIHVAGAEDSTRVVTVLVRHAGEPVADAIVRSARLGAHSDSAGVARLTLPAEPRVVTVTRLGYRPDTIALPVGGDTTVMADLVQQVAALSNVTVTSTRAERRLEDEPLRIEVLAGDDVAEKNAMRPADLRTLFTEMSGVRVQATSASLGAASVRVQGLRGRYTTVLNDGLPLHGAHSGGFSLVQQPPLDLLQAEVIKGAASALYGSAALGGVVNLVSRRPPDTSQVLLNQTARGGSDALAFVARSLTPALGVTLLGGAHLQRAADSDRDGWADIAGFRRAEIRPRLFYHDSAGRSLMVTAGGFDEIRGGGSMPGASFPQAAAGLADSLATHHGDAGAIGRWRMSDSWSLAARAAASVQTRRRRFAGVLERERQEALLGEVTATGVSRRNTLVAGLSWEREGYRNTDVPRFDETLTTPSALAQHTWTPVAWLSSTLNGRCDASNTYGTICTPRASLLARAGENVSVRASAGSGWFAPAALDEQTEIFGLTRVTRPTPLDAERARTASLDVTVTRGPLQVNGTLFRNVVRNPVGLRRSPGDTTGNVEMVNAPGSMRTQGGEVFAVYAAEPVIATAYWSEMRSREPSPATGAAREVPLTPRRAAGLDVALEDDESGGYIAAEVFYTGVQALDDDPYRAFSRPYTTFGLLGAWRFGRVTAFLNLENLTNVMQTHWEPILRPVGARPGDGGAWTVPPWAPLEGRSANLGARFAL